MSATATRWLGVLLIASAGFCSTATAARAPSLQGGQAPRAPSPPPPAIPLPETRIAAVVNDEAISVADVTSRLKMVMLSSNLPDTPEMRQRIANQVLRQLVDEKLQMQEAKRQNVTASEAEINKAYAQIEKQNNLPPGQLEQILKQHGIERSALVDQLTASIVWAKLVRRRLLSETSLVSDEEIDYALQRAKENANEPQSRVAEIFLAVDNPQQDEEVRRLAERLTEQMKQGARFSAVAQQFSQSATAAVGGDIGWVRPEQLSPELGKALAQMRPGELSPPIRTGAGYYLLLVLDRRSGRSEDPGETLLHLVQIVFPLPSQANDAIRRAAIIEAQNAKTTAKSCDEMLRIGKEKGSPQLSSEGRLRAEQIAPGMRKIVSGLQPGQSSPPILQKNGVGVIMLCGKEAPSAPTIPTREQIAETLTRQRLDTLARRYMRDLRRAAFVDVRV
ncbi:MAG: peptidylprolyl isomerase [Alphaproteobacteria bacterium]|nr:peptidylprolyl isomerase [Alphaproteobacteria bacterium]